MLLLFSFLLFCFSRGVLPHLVRLDQHPWRQLRGRNPRLYRFLVTIALTLTLTGAGHAQFPGARPQPGVPASVRLRGYSAMCFETNRGQAPAVVSFLARGLGYSLFLTSDQAIFVLQGYAPVSHGPTQNAPGSTSAGTFTPLTTAVLRMELVGGRSLAHAAGATRLPGQVNYLTGKDLHTWHVHVPLYAAVQYRQVYPGIDLLYHGTQRQLEYDFIVAPHISARAIALRFKGATSLALDHSGGLVVAVGNRTVLWHRPVLYQTIRGRRKIVDGNYIIGKRQTVTFRVGAYDPAKPLVIDPILAYSTYLGASTIDYASAVTVGSDGCAYIAGRTGSTLFPNTSGLLDETKAGSFVTKLDPTGRRIVYTTYFGTFSSCGGIAVDTAGDAYVTGSTYTQITSDGSYNSDFPVTPGAYLSGIRTTAPISAGFLAELAPDGSRLLYATLLGGSQGSSGERIALEGHRRVYVAGNTSSLDFPVTPRGLHLPWVAPPHYRKVWQIQQTFVTAFAVERSSRASLVYSALLGNTTLRGFAVDSSGRAALTGMTSRQDFPVTPDALQPGFLGASGYPLDGFGPAQSAYVAELDNTGSPVYGTFLGGGTPLLPSGLALDQGGAIYLAAYAGSGVPTTAAHQATSSISGPFVMKIDPTRVGTSSLVYATYLGSLGNAQDNSSVGMVGQLRLTDTSAIAVNAAGDAYVTGSTDDPNFPTTPDAIEAAYNSRGQGAPTAFLSILDPSGTRLLWSSYLGEGGRTGGPALAIDRFGDAYVAGTTTFNLFTTTPGSYLQFPPGGLLDGFVLKVSGQVPSGPYIANLRPYPAFVGEGGQQITITGTGFVPGIAVSFNGGPPVSPTAFSPTRLSVTLPEQAAASPQPVLISVFNPPSGDWASAILPVIDPAPTVILLSPTSLAAHKGEDMIRIYGSGMVPGTMVSFNNGPPVPITYDMPSASFVTVPAGVLAHPGTVDVAVINPAPRSGTAHASLLITNDGPRTLSGSDLEGLVITRFRIRDTASPGNPAKGKSDQPAHSQIVATVDAINETRYLINSLTVRLDLYTATPDGGETVGSSQTYTVTKYMYPSAEREQDIDSAPLESGLKPEARFTGYFMTLVSAQGTPYQIDPALTPMGRLMMAAIDGDIAVLEEVALARPDLIRGGREPLRGATVLGEAAAAGHRAAISFLLAHGAPIDLTDRLGFTPLLYAVSWHNAASVRVLLAHHANITLRDPQGRTPLQLAVSLAGLNGAGDSESQIVQILEAAEGNKHRAGGK